MLVTTLGALSDVFVFLCKPPQDIITINKMEYVWYFFTCLKSDINNSTINSLPSGVLLLILKITLFVYHVRMLLFLCVKTSKHFILKRTYNTITFQ